MTFVSKTRFSLVLHWLPSPKISKVFRLQQIPLFFSIRGPYIFCADAPWNFIFRKSYGVKRGWPFTFWWEKIFFWRKPCFHTIRSNCSVKFGWLMKLLKKLIIWNNFSRIIFVAATEVKQFHLKSVEQD